MLIRTVPDSDTDWILDYKTKTVCLTRSRPI
jgi:hypothetical protein